MTHASPVRFQLILQNLREVGVFEPRVEGGDAALQVSERPVRHRSTEINCPGHRTVRACMHVRRGPAARGIVKVAIGMILIVLFCDGTHNYARLAPFCLVLPSGARHSAPRRGRYKASDLLGASAS